MTIPHTKYGHSINTHFRYLSCPLDRGHIMTDCTAESNKKNNYNWPANGKPSALGYQVTFGKAQIINCTSINGKNNISGAVLTGNCKGF